MLKSRKIKKSLSVLAAAALSCALVLPMAGPAFVHTDAATKAKAVEYTKDNGQLRNVMYYADWSIYQSQGVMNPNKIPADQLTHLNFAFLDFDRNGNLQFTDKEAAVDAIAGIEGATKGSPGAGLLNALKDVKAVNPNLRTGISVGGWTKSANFSLVARDADLRAKFAKNLAKFVLYTGMDFVDIDWEYPGANSLRYPDLMDNAGDTANPYASADDVVNYISLLKDIRTELDALQKETGKYYELSVAISASPWMLEGTDIAELYKVVDFTNVMTYDMYGSWEPHAYHQSALYSNDEPNRPLVNNPAAWNHGQPIDTSMSVNNTVKHLLTKGAVASKIVVGIAMYTRGWEQVATNGGVTASPGLYGSAAAVNENSNGSPSNGADNHAPLIYGDGGLTSGIWPYRAMPELKKAYPGLTEYWDDVAKANYMYAENGAFFTYDSPRSIEEKAKYVKGLNTAGVTGQAVQLGGLIGWMQSNDAETVKGSGVRNVLTKAMKQGLFGDASLVDYNTMVTSGPNIQTTVQKVSGGYEIKLKNAEKLVETDAVLRELEESNKSVLTPTAYVEMINGKTITAGTNSGKVTMISTVGAINLYEVEKSSVISPGETITFTVKSNGTKLGDIGSIVLTQRLAPTMTEFVSQVIKGARFATPAQLRPAKPAISVTSRTIKMSNTTAKNSYKLTIKNNVKGSTYAWKSSNTKVAAVAANGTVRALRIGKTTITCTMKTANNTYTLKSVITVTGPKLAKATIAVRAKRSATIGIANKVPGAIYRYAVANKRIAQVSSRGIVKGVKRGNTTVVITITFPKASGLAAMKVTQRIAVR